MAIRFGTEICGDSILAEEREWLICNGLGSYGCGTVAGRRTRSYHGLLVAALAAPADPCTRTLLVAGVEEWGGPQRLPLDPATCVSFALEGTVPVWRYAIGEALLEKRLWMKPGAHTTTAHYRLLQASRPLRLEVAVLVNPRSHHGGRDRPPLGLRALARGVEVVADLPGVPPFRVLADRGDFELAGDDDLWCAVSLRAERERGLPELADQRRICRIRAELCPEAASFTLVFSTEVDPSLDGEVSLVQRRRHEAALLDQWRAAQPRLAEGAPSWVRQLVLAADQFVVARDADPAGEAGVSILAGYPWFGDWGRDTMISLGGLTLATGRPALTARILRTYARHLSGGMLPNRFPEGGHPLGAHDYNTVDATLWFFEALRQYHQVSGDVVLIAELFPALRQIVVAHQRGTRHGIGVDPADGLLRAGAAGLQLTWMDAKVNGDVITPRRGKPVEVNALWFCALRTMERFAALCGESGEAYAELAERARSGFQRFWNPAVGCCFDVLDGPDGAPDAALRPNQLLALAFSDELLSPQQARRLLEVCGQHLLTPLGLRSLDPRDPRYRGHYGGGPLQRDSAYHQGTVWAWWLGPWALAHARVYGTARPALRWLEAIGDHLASAGLGSVSEILDGDPPHQPRGCIAQAWSVAEVLRAWSELTRLEARGLAPPQPSSPHLPELPR